MLTLVTWELLPNFSSWHFFFVFKAYFWRVSLNVFIFHSSQNFNVLIHFCKKVGPHRFLLIEHVSVFFPLVVPIVLHLTTGKTFSDVCVSNAPKDSCVEDLSLVSQSIALLGGGGGIFSRRDLVEVRKIIERLVLRRDIGELNFLASSFVSLFLWSKLFLPPCTVTNVIRTTGPSNNRLGPPKPSNKTSFSSFYNCVRYFASITEN